jgi:hypothetical protein
LNKGITMRIRTILAAAAAPAALAAVLLGTAGQASAAVKPPTATIVASTHVSGVPDTTVGGVKTGFWEDGTGHKTTDESLSVYGPVWAIDDVTNKWQIKPLGNGYYAVDRQVIGTFQAFAQPNAGATAPALDPQVNGQMNGTNSYVVYAPNGPDATKLPSEEPPATGSHAQLLQLFPGITDDATHIQGGNTWVFAYHAAHGSMTQRYDTLPDTWGNITG